ncbi:toprim domain-containing protein [bacterium]|nr:toprim domain-containing protein [bacterium]
MIERPSDTLALEETGRFRERYHVLGCLLSPLDGIGPENLRIEKLHYKNTLPAFHQTGYMIDAPLRSLERRGAIAGVREGHGGGEDERARRETAGCGIDASREVMHSIRHI